jgi:hypothetical protein
MEKKTEEGRRQFEKRPGGTSDRNKELLGTKVSKKNIRKGGSEKQATRGEIKDMRFSKYVFLNNS